MAGKKTPPVLEGEIVEEKPKASPREKAAGQKSKQYVSEKVIKLVVLVLVLFALAYWGYPIVKDKLGGLFAQPEPVTSETSPAPDESAVEQTKPTTAAEQPEAAAQDQADAPAEDTGTSPEMEGTETPPTEAEQQTPETQAAEPQVSEPQTTEPQATVPAQATPSAAEDTRINALEAELAALKQSFAQIEAAVKTPGASFAVAVAELAPPLYQSRPYTGQLEQVRVMILDMPALDQVTLAEPLGVLAKFSTQGITDLQTLNQGFDAAALQALRDEGVSSASSWWQRTWARIKGLVVIRRTDGTGGSSLEMALRQMESDLATGDVASALKTLETLPAEEAGAFKDWAALASDRAAALEAYDTLVNFVARQSTTVVGSDHKP